MTKRPSFLAVVAMSAIAVVLSGCRPKEPAESPKKPDAATKATQTPSKPTAETPKPEKSTESGKKAATTEPAEEKIERMTREQEIEQLVKKTRDLGPPLVDDLDNLKRLHPEQPVWIDMQNKQVVLQGEVCSAGYPLEFFATYPNRAYEAVLSVNVQPSFVHAGLLAVGAKAGHPVRFQPKFSPPTGTEIAIEVRWKDAKGKIQSAPAQHWIRNIKTKKILDVNWVFAGSTFVTDESTGARSYQADSGELICMLSLPNAMLDLPRRGDSAMESRNYEAFTEHLPPEGTPTTLLLKPILAKKADKPGTANKSSSVIRTGGGVFVPGGIKDIRELRAEAEQQAIAAATAWLDLVDRGEYSQSWETAAGLLKDRVERRDFVKSVSDVRKQLGKVTSRQIDSREFQTTLPGAPDGRYVVLKYKTSFANKKSAVETITPMLDKDKKWRVSGYYVK